MKIIAHSIEGKFRILTGSVRRHCYVFSATLNTSIITMGVEVTGERDKGEKLITFT
jgi:hypothetical protein